ncbi:hypothetical protein [Streptomyces rochei]|uniref:hypothetical protein n=1 Tax=Streptomyces rochei TaxID=1928 RepID=UPI0036AF8BE8
MTITPKPITEDTNRMSDRSPLGTRYTDGTETYTLVAYSIDPLSPQYARPAFVADNDLTNPSTHWYDRLANGTLPLLYPEDICGEDETLTVAAEDSETSTKARTAAVKQYQARPYRDTGEFSRVMAFGDLTTDEELAAFIEFAKTEVELRQVQWKLEHVSRERSETIARICDLKGSQQAAAQTLGVNQSTVSRALRERPEMP